MSFANHDVLMKVANVIGGEEAVKIVEELSRVNETTDDEITAKTGINVSTVRKILYNLYDHSLVALRRNRDEKTGWFIFHWRLQPDQLDGFLTIQKKHILEKLEVRLDYEKNHDFYYCHTPGCRRLTFEEASESVFRCPKCDKPLMYVDNEKIVEFLSQKVEQLRNELQSETSYRNSEE